MIPSPIVAPPTPVVGQSRITDANDAPSTATKGRLDDASLSEIDSHLPALVRHTSLENPSRSEHSGSLRTISERDLKDWIKEALSRAITTSTHLDEKEIEQILATARNELAVIMRVHHAEGTAHVPAASAWIDLRAEQADKDERQSTANMVNYGLISDLQVKLITATSQCESFAQRVLDLELLLKESLFSPHGDVHELNHLREQLDERTADVIRTDAGRDKAQRETRAVASRLLRHQENAVDEKSALNDRIAAGDRTIEELDRRNVDAARRADKAEAQLHAIQDGDSMHYAASARQEADILRADLVTTIEEAESTRTRLASELADARTEMLTTQKELASALQSRGAVQDESQRHVLKARETLLATERDRQRSAESLQAAQADQIQTEQALGASDQALVLMVRERDQLLHALQTADRSLQAMESQVRQIATERDEAVRIGKAAGARARKPVAPRLLPRSPCRMTS